MGEYDKKPARAAATAGPSADDRYGPGPIASNLKSRIIRNDIVDGRTLITIARGSGHGIRVGMEGYVRGRDGIVADFQIHEVRGAATLAFVDVTPHELRDNLEVVINPTDNGRKAMVKETSSRVISLSVEGDRTRIVIGLGSANGVTMGMRGQLPSDDGAEGDDFQIHDALAKRSVAYIRNTPDYVRAHSNVVLHPNPRYARAPVQRRADGPAASSDVQSTAQAGVAGATGRLPHFDTIQRAFGKHDISGVQAQVGGPAADAAGSLGARAYATGDKVAFASAPDLHTAAHEATHTIQQSRGAVGFQGLGAADDEHEHHADAVADEVVAGRSAEPLLDSIAAGGAGTTAIQRKETRGTAKPGTAEPVPQWKLAAPEKIDLGDTVVDRRTTHRSSIFALHRVQGPRIRAALHGDASMKLLSAPLFLPGSGSPYSDTSAFLFEHRPSQKGDVTSTLVLEILDDPSEVFRYPVVATAHLPGEPTMAEQQQAQEQRRRDELAGEQKLAERKRVEKRIEADYARGTSHQLKYFGELEDERIKVQAAIGTLYKQRRDGLGTASIEIGDFVREKRIAKPSLLEQLALLALDIATAGIAGGLAKRLEVALTTVFRIPVPKYLPDDPKYPRLERESTPSRALVAIFTDGFKEGVKKSVKLRADSSQTGKVNTGRDDVAVKPNGDTYAKQSSDPKAAFFSLQYEQLAFAGGERAAPMSIFARNALLPTLETQPQAAIAAMKAMKNAIEGEWDAAHAVQLEETVRKWVRYLAESNAEATSLQVRGFDEKHPAPAADGVIDLAIKPSYRNPERPVEVIGARLLGVKKAVVDRLAKQPLIHLDVPVRVSGGFDGSPSATLTVVRESGGRIKYVENVNGDGRARWLERKSIANGRGADAEAGARVLIEREIMSHRLYALVDGVEHDSKE